MNNLSLAIVSLGTSLLLYSSSPDVAKAQQHINTGKTVICPGCDLSDNLLPRSTDKAKKRGYSGANLKDANLRFARGADMNFSGADLTNANLAGEKGKLVTRRAEFDRANFTNITAPGLTGSYSTFEGADFSNANLAGANFGNAILKNAHFNDAICKSIDFRRADMTGVHLDGADCSQCNFAYADLTGASIKGTIFKHANLKDAIWTDGKRCTDVECKKRT